MRLYEELFKSADGAALSRCIVVPDGGGYFEGVKYVEDFSQEKIVLRFSHCGVEIEGVNLSISKYCDGDLEIGGKIRFLQVFSDEKGKNPDRKQGGK